MLNNDNRFATTGSGFAATAMTRDAGLRTHMLRVYNTVGAGLAVSGAIAYGIATVPALQQIFFNPIVGIITLLVAMFMIWNMTPAKSMNRSVGNLQGRFYLFAALLGTSLSYYFAAYSGASLTRVFFITSAMFAATSLVGYTTKRDLTSMGNFMMMGLWGIIIASVVNYFLHSTGLMFIVSIICVIVFTGLIAFETQQAKRLYSAANDDDTNHKLAIFSAVGLYLNFINLFQALMNLMGNNR